jgi:hypothetical protein
MLSAGACVGVVARELAVPIPLETRRALFWLAGMALPLMYVGEEGFDLDAPLVLTLFLRDGPASLLGGFARFLGR